MLNRHEVHLSASADLLSRYVKAKVRILHVFLNTQARLDGFFGYKKRAL